jgi:membrane protein DedA with SNARE-associated domain
MIAQVFGFLVGFISQFGYYAVFVGMVLESACIPIPSEIIMPLAGFLAFQGKMDFWIAVAIGTIASVIGSYIAYYVGLKGGRPFIEKHHLVSQKDLKKADDFFEKYSIESVFIGRFVPIVRTFISLPAGVAETNISKFIVYTLVGTFLWNLALAFAGFKLGENWIAISGLFSYFDFVVLAAVVLVVVYLIFKKVGLRKKPLS